MGIVDAIQDVIVEIAGIVVFLAGVWWFVGDSIAAGVGGILIGLVMMGYKTLPRRIARIYKGK